MSFLEPGQRIAIRGLSGSGKTTLATTLSELLQIPHTELDELFWRPNWQESTDEEFLSKVAVVAQNPNWIICGNYSRCRHLIDPSADTIIWLDYPFWLTYRRQISRTFRRCLQKNILWGHSTETFRQAFFAKNALVFWNFRVHRRHRQQMLNLFQNPDPSKIYLHFPHPQETEAWLHQLKR
ncbi:hypothetical protein CCB80_13140 [Armatimonadetes bacterium Uphvl-Ar1]|nr:hypothetical protein CCB80_13140 [Armatimonadetes bacterium Uphvl-Ar1]